MRQEVSRWIVIFLIGVFTGLIACVIDLAIKNLARIKYDHIQQCILDYDMCGVGDNQLWYGNTQGFGLVIAQNYTGV